MANVIKHNKTKEELKEMFSNGTPIEEGIFQTLIEETYTPDIDIPEAPVTSVNGQTGEVVIDIPEPVELPENIVTSVDGQTGDVTLDSVVKSVNGKLVDENGNVSLTLREIEDFSISEGNGFIHPVRNVELSLETNKGELFGINMLVDIRTFEVLSVKTAGDLYLKFSELDETFFETDLFRLYASPDSDISPISIPTQIPATVIAIEEDGTKEVRLYTLKSVSEDMYHLVNIDGTSIDPSEVPSEMIIRF